VESPQNWIAKKVARREGEGAGVGHLGDDREDEEKKGETEMNSWSCERKAV